MKSIHLLVATLVAMSTLATGARAQEPERLSYGSRAGMDVMILGKSGIGTSKAVIKIKMTRENAAEFCELYLNDTSAGCAKKVLREDGSRIRPTVSGNCKTGTFTDMYGYSYAFKGRNKKKSDNNIADYIIINRKTGKVLDGFSSSGYGVAIGVFEVLCPRSLTSKSVDGNNADTPDTAEPKKRMSEAEEKEIASRAVFARDYDAWRALDPSAQAGYMMGVSDEEILLVSSVSWERAKAVGLAKCIRGQGLTASTIAQSVTAYYEANPADGAVAANDVFVRAIVFDTCIDFINKELVSRNIKPWKRRG